MDPRPCTWPDGGWSSTGTFGVTAAIGGLVGATLACVWCGSATDHNTCWHDKGKR